MRCWLLAVRKDPAGSDSPVGELVQRPAGETFNSRPYPELRVAYAFPGCWMTGMPAGPPEPVLVEAARRTAFDHGLVAMTA